MEKNAKKKFGVTRTFDSEVLINIFNHPQVHGWIVDDKSPDFHKPIINPAIIYLVDESKKAVVQIDPLNGISCNVHVAALPEMWGIMDGFVRESIIWGFKNTRYMKAVAMIPAYNRCALGIAKRAGFVNEGVLRKSFLRKWKLHDQIILGLCKEDVSWLQE